MAGATAGTIVGGKYRLEEPIGQGGMASVWRAVHTTLESSVAVKFLDTYGIAREKMAKRFLREAKLSANLRHRNVVHILDYGVLDDGQPYMVMELLEGQSLADRMGSEGEKLTDLGLLDAMAQILGGLAAVHDAGIVHRDVKPDNIFLVRDADGDYPKLLDFGISRGVDASVGDTRMTNTGAVVGTPLYMSPEQARGLPDLDVRTDLWSVGMVLYEGLAGFCPFESQNMGDVLIRVATEEPPPLSEVRPDLPPLVTDTVMRALEKDRESRWLDARTMRDALLEGADELAGAGGRSVDATGRRRTQPRRAAPAPAAEWEESDTEIDPSAIEEAADPATLPAASSPRWMLALVIGVVAFVAAGVFIATGGRIRFGTEPPDESAAAASQEVAATRVAEEPTAPPEREDTEQRPPEEAPEAAAAGTPAPPETATEQAPSAATGPTEAPTPSTPAAAHHRGQTNERTNEQTNERPIEPDEEATRASPRRRGRRARTASSPSTTDRPPSPASRPAAQPSEEGPFLRDLDY